MQLADKIRNDLAAGKNMKAIATHRKCTRWQVYKVSMTTTAKLPVGRPRKTPRCVTGANQRGQNAVPVPPQSSDENG